MYLDLENMFRIEIIYYNVEGKIYEEDFDGIGRFKEEVIENLVLKVL